VSVRLPLTLAIMDGMSVGVGDEVLHPAAVVGGRELPGQAPTPSRPWRQGRVVKVRDEYMPVIDLEKVFEVPRFDFERVSATSWWWSRPRRPCRPAGRRTAGPAAGGGEEPGIQLPQGRPDVSGATIMGDGRVA
jgi:two-component system chemotaxis sensor kinase CheA